MEITDSNAAEIAAKVKADKQLPRVMLLSNKYGRAFFRPATAAEYQRLVDEQAKPELKTTALKRLVLACAVYPEGAEFAALLEAKPGLAQTFGNEIAADAGLFAETEKKEF
jgi:hypothetical protein